MDHETRRRDSGRSAPAWLLPGCWLLTCYRPMIVSIVEIVRINIESPYMSHGIPLSLLLWSGTMKTNGNVLRFEVGSLFPLRFLFDVGYRHHILWTKSKYITSDISKRQIYFKHFSLKKIALTSGYVYLINKNKYLGLLI